MMSIREVFETNTLEALCELVKGYDENPAWGAGTLALLAAEEAGLSITPENIRGQLKILSAEGAAFNENEAVGVAMEIHAATRGVSIREVRAP